MIVRRASSGIDGQGRTGIDEVLQERQQARFQLWAGGAERDRPLEDRIRQLMKSVPGGQGISRPKSLGYGIVDLVGIFVVHLALPPVGNG